jgi:hypothetical protein
MSLSISQEDFRNKCLYCKKPLAVKYISHEVEDNLSEVVFLDSHKICAKLAFEISLLENEINLQEKNLLKLKKRQATLKMKEAIKCITLG